MKVLLVVLFSFLSQPSMAILVNTMATNHSHQDHKIIKTNITKHSHQHNHKNDHEDEHHHSHNHGSLIQIDLQNLIHDTPCHSLNRMNCTLNKPYICQYISNPQPEKIFRPPIKVFAFKS